MRNCPQEIYGGIFNEYKVVLGDFLEGVGFSMDEFYVGAANFYHGGRGGISGIYGQKLNKKIFFFS